MSKKTLDLHQYFPYFLGTIANKWASSSSRIYLSEFGIGIATWRVLASISSIGEATSQDVAILVSMDAGAVSRAVGELEKSGHIKKVEGRFPGRTKPYTLTASGRKLYSDILKIALKREALLLAGLSDSEKKSLLRIMQKLSGNLELL